MRFIQKSMRTAAVLGAAALLYATIIRLSSSRTELLDINIHLLNHFTPSRIDLSSNYAIVTKEDRQAPALLALRNGYFYEQYLHEIAVATQQAFPVPHLNRPFTVPQTFDKNVTREMLDDLKLLPPSNEAAIIERACSLLNNDHNPYA